MSENSGLSEEFARHLDSIHKLDTTETFTRLLETRDKAWDKISSSLPFVEDMHCADIHEFNDLEGNP